MNENKSSIGSIVGIIIILTLIILGGLYFWGKRIEESKVTASMTTSQNEPLITNPDQNEASAIRSVGSSDDTDSIKADLQNTKLDNLDAELNTSAQ